VPKVPGVRGVLIAALLAGAGPWLGAQSAPVSDVVGVGNFSHVVRDMDRAVAFYRDVLGLEVGASQPFSPNPAIMRLGNTLGAQSKMVQLRAGLHDGRRAARVQGY